jgi:hypothetical protein
MKPLQILMMGAKKALVVLIDTCVGWTDNFRWNDVECDSDDLVLKEIEGLDFDGNDYINMGNIYGSTVDNMTITAWVKTTQDTSSTDAYILQQRSAVSIDGQFVFSSAGNKISFWDYDTDRRFNGSGNTSINDGEWHHIAFVKSGGTSGTFYLDGESDGTISGASVNYNSDLVSSIGQDRRDSNRRFNGKMSDIRIYARALSATEIEDMYKGDSVSSTSLTAQWKLDEGTGSTAGDSAGDNDGTITGATWFSEYPETGERVSNPILIPAHTTSNIKWESTEPTDTDIKVYTGVSDADDEEPEAGKVDVLIVAGGGGGGSGGGGGGGGAGGLKWETDVNLIGDTSVTVGAGGAVGSSGSSNGSNGVDSVFGDITATGGGGGASFVWNTAKSGNSGGSGGGGEGSYGGVQGGGGGGISGEGNAGGAGKKWSSNIYKGGGGGGANASGSNASDTFGGNGGAGKDYSTELGTTYGVSGVFAGGGGGGAHQESSTVGTGGTGGAGGGGNGCKEGTDPVAGSAGTVNTGGGGGCGYAGGSGIVLVRYKTDGSYGIDPETATGGTKYTFGNYTIHAFTSNGTFSPSVPGSYAEATNDSTIPDLVAGKYLYIKQVLSTEDTDETPKLSSLRVEIK